MVDSAVVIVRDMTLGTIMRTKRRRNVSGMMLTMPILTISMMSGKIVMLANT